MRVIYYFWTGGPEFWLFTLYDKDEMDDLTPKQREVLKQRVKDELKMKEAAMTKSVICLMNWSKDLMPWPSSVSASEPW